jgi:hypothetical protein
MAADHARVTGETHTAVEIAARASVIGVGKAESQVRFAMLRAIEQDALNTRIDVQMARKASRYP